MEPLQEPPKKSSQDEEHTMEPPKESSQEEDHKFLWKWRKYLLLLAALVASVTYVAGLNPPGGVLSEEHDTDHRIGDPVLPLTYDRRYTAFFYCNATAFVASLVVIMTLLDRRVGGTPVGVTVLRFAMLLDLLALMAAFAAGSCRDVSASIYVSVLFAVVFAYVAVHVLVAAKLDDTDCDPADHEDLKQRRKCLLLLATFATPLTYGAGLAPPGGFWSKTDLDLPLKHLAGVPVLHDGDYARRYQAFYYFNGTSFVASLAIIMLLMSRTLSGRVLRSYALHVCVLVELLGLMGAYAAGSCRKIETTVYVVSLAGAVLLYIALQVAISKILQCRPNMNQEEEAHMKKEAEEAHKEQEEEARKKQEEELQVTPPNNDAEEEMEQSRSPIPLQVKPPNNDAQEEDKMEQSRSLLLLLATLAATVTYQAGLSPPGGSWPNAVEHHIAGDPVLLEMHPKRYKAFFHCNTAAFVASLVVIVIVQSNKLSSGAVVRRRAVQAAMILDLLGLMGAYAAGSCRDVATTIYVSALAAAVFVYAIGKVVASTTLGLRESKLMLCVDAVVVKVLNKLQLSNGGQPDSDDDLEKKRKFLLQLAILAATVTYQTGLSPPGGFWPASTNAGDPVLLDHYTSRYLVFFYSNATGFMASVVVILILVNQQLYKQGIQCHALHACVVVGLLGLMGAYAAGSCRNLLTSIYVLALVAAVIAFLVLQVLLLMFAGSLKLPNAPQWLRRLFVPMSPPEQSPAGGDPKKTNGEQREQYVKSKYLMLLGILAASVTYQAGLVPPGGTWGDDTDKDGRYLASGVPGNPILHDTDRPRYRAFFYCNATSFVASVVVIVLLLQRTLKARGARSPPLWAIQTAVVLDLLGLLGAYAAGSCRELETSAYVISLVAAVVVYIALHVLLSLDAVMTRVEKLPVWKYYYGDQIAP